MEPWWLRPRFPDAYPYTIKALAKFLGFVKDKNQRPTDSFVAAFSAEELIADGVLKESQIKGLSTERLGELVISVRKQRDAAKAETERSVSGKIESARTVGCRFEILPWKIRLDAPRKLQATRGGT